MFSTRPLALSVATLAVLAAAASGDDFERSATGVVSPDPAITMTLVPAPAGLGAGKALRIAWPSDHKPYVQFYYDPLRPAPEITADGGSVTVAVWCEAMAGVRSLSVRFTDAKFETFQWSTELPNPEQAGWRSVRIAIDPKAAKGNWGPEGQVDGVIDWPVQFNGFAFDFADPKTPAGALLLDNVVFAPATKP